MGGIQDQVGLFLLYLAGKAAGERPSVPPEQLLIPAGRAEGRLMVVAGG
jgi:hypothetical protein